MSAGESSCPTAVGVGGSGLVSRETTSNNGVGSDQMINQSPSVLSDLESRRQSLMRLAIMTDPVWRIELGGFKFSKLSDDMLGMITVPAANPGQSKALARPKAAGENSPPDGHRVQVKEFFFHSNRCASPLPPPSHSHNPTTATQRSLTVSMQGYLKYPPGSDNYEN